MPAAELYDSPWFRKAVRYAQPFAGDWYILSDKHSLLEIDEVIVSYDVSMRDFSKAERKAWAREVLQDLEPIPKPGDTVMLLASQIYREYLEEPLKRMGCQIERPLKGLRIGEQMHWLDQTMLKEAISKAAEG